MRLLLLLRLVRHADYLEHGSERRDDANVVPVSPKFLLWTLAINSDSVRGAQRCFSSSDRSER
jgi:hypothetical protein